MASHKEMAFNLGTMGSRKTLRLMIDQFQFDEDMGYNTLIIKPGDDIKAGTNIQTRAFGGAALPALVMPKEAEATEFVTKEMRITERRLGSRAGWKIYLDEVSLFAAEQIKSLRINIVDPDIADVEMYGLLTDFSGDFFPGTVAALQYADIIRQLSNVCQNKGCKRTAMRV